MNALLSYLLQSTCIAGLLYSYYHVALRNKQFHQYNRFYLLVSALLAIVLPLLQIPVYFTKTEAESSFVLQTLTVISPGNPAEPVLEGEPLSTGQSFLTMGNFLRMLYILVSILILSRVVISLLKIRQIIRQNQVEQVDDIKFVNTSEPGTPFSFFRWLFWNRDIPLKSDKGRHIFRHEFFHIHQKHSLDVLFMELITMILWINPFFHLMKKEIRAIHEFLADRYAMHEERKWEYAEMLLMQAFQTKQHLVNPFFHNQIKRRIAMITTSSKPSYRYARKLMVLPLVAVAAAIFAFSYRKSQETIVSSSTKPITVVIDAGHGGTDNGAVSAGGIYEKDIVLAIAKKVKELNDDPNVTIILTRDGDEFPSLKSRTDLANEKKTDLFISLHMNSTTGPTTKSGIEIYLPRESKPNASESRILASILLNYMHNVYSVPPSIRHAESGIWVLDKPTCPSALIELGHLQNDNDLKIIRNTENQEKIAGYILKAIDQYMTQRSGVDWEEKKKKISDAQANDNASGESALDYALTKGDDVNFYAKTITVEEVPGRLYEFSRNAIYVINGKIMKSSELKGNHIEANSLFVYGPNDEKAIKKYGWDAKPGVYEFEGATIRSISPKVDTIPDKLFSKVEIEPAFPGGNEAWAAYLKSNLDNSITKGKHLKDGAYTVVVQFIVDTEGNIIDVRPLTKHGFGMEDEAVRVIKQGPNWRPALQNGHKVNAYKKQPITFIVGKGEIGFRPDGVRR